MDKNQRVLMKRSFFLVLSVMFLIITLLGNSLVYADNDISEESKKKYTNGSGDAVDWGLTLLGMKEGSDQHHKMVDDLDQFFGQKKENGYNLPWCAAFASWCSFKAGYSEDVETKSWMVDGFDTWATQKGITHNLGGDYTPVRNDLWSQPGKHIERVIEGIDSGNALCVSGNSSLPNKGGDGVVIQKNYNTDGYWIATGASGGTPTGGDTTQTQGAQTMAQAGASGVADYFAKTEWELEGMGGAGLKRDFDDFNIDLPTKDSLSTDSQQWVQQFGEIITSARATRVINVVRAVIATIALWLVFYAVFLYFAYWLDRLNNYYELRLLNTLTLGRLEVSPDDKTSTFHKHGVSGERVVIHKDMVYLVVVIITVSMLILSGKAYALMQAFINLIQSVITEVL